MSVLKMEPFKKKIPEKWKRVWLDELVPPCLEQKVKLFETKDGVAFV